MRDQMGGELKAVQEAIRTALRDQFPETELQSRLAAITSDTLLAELGIDSVAVVEVAVYLDEVHGVLLSEDGLATVRTVGDLTRIMQEETAGLSKAAR